MNQSLYTCIESKTRRYIKWAFGLTLMFLGLILAIVAPVNKRRNSRCSATTRGTLIDSYHTRNSKGDRTVRYIYSYFVNGIEYKLTSTILSSEANQIGDYCTIWYNPKKPGDAQPFHYESAKIYTIILIVGIVMIILGIGMIGFGVTQ